MPVDESVAFHALHVGVLTVSDTRTPDTDRSGTLIVDRLESAGHRIAGRCIVKDEIPLIEAQVAAWVARADVDIIITTGGTGLAPRDVTPEAIAPLATKTVPGFGELFRRLSVEEIGTSTVQSRAEAVLCRETFVFMLPGSTGACRLAMDAILIEQLDHRHKPCNFAELVPRIGTRLRASP